MARKVEASGIVVMEGRNLYGVYEDFGIDETYEIMVEDHNVKEMSRFTFHDLQSVSIGPPIKVR